MSDEETHAAILRMQDKVASKASQGKGKATCERVQHLCNFIHKWTCGSDLMTLPQLKSSLKNMGVTVAEEDTALVFEALNGSTSGSLKISDFCEAMIDEDYSWKVRSHKPNVKPAGGGKKEIPSEEELRRETAYPQGVMGSGGYHLGAFPTLMPEGSWAPTTVAGVLVEDARPHPGYQGEVLKPRGEKEVWQTGRVAMVPSQQNRDPRASTTKSVSSQGGSQRSGRQSPAESSLYHQVPRDDSPRDVRDVRDLNLSDMFLAQFRSVVLQRGSGALHDLAKCLRHRDSGLDRGNRRSPNPRQALQTALRDFGIGLTQKDVDLLWLAATPDSGAATSLNDFLNGLFGPVSAWRQELVLNVWRALDAQQVKKVAANTLDRQFDPKGHPDVILRRMHWRNGREHFSTQFDGVTENGYIPKGQFMDYYASVSAAIEDDDTFETIIKTSWPELFNAHAQNAGGRSKATGGKDVLVKFHSGEQRVVTLNADLGKDIHHEDTVKRHLKSMGIKNVASCAVAR